MESHIANALNLTSQLLPVPHWLMILENMLEVLEIGVIVGLTVTLIYLVSERHMFYSFVQGLLSLTSALENYQSII